MDLFFTTKRNLTIDDISKEINSAGYFVYKIKDIVYFGNSEING